MGLGSALSTAVSGLNVNQSAIDVIGNNLANTNTFAFKSSRNEFVSSFYNTLSLGTVPSASTGGTNPRQVGQGSVVGSIAVDFRPGGLSQTGVPSDLFIQGGGFFTVKRGDKEVLFTRDGSFRLNSNAELVNAQGLKVQGFGVDSNFDIQEGSLVDLTIPLGVLTVAQATRTASIQGTLNPTGVIATQGSIIQTNPLLAGGAPATSASLLQNITVGGVPLLTGALPATLTYTPHKGGRQLEPQTLTVTATTTLGELGDFIVGSLGIHTTTTTPPALPGAGFSVNGAGQLVVTGNLGKFNDVVIDGSDFSMSNGGSLNLDFPNLVQSANGESVVSQFAAFDSLGSDVLVQITAYLESLSTGSSTFRVLFESPANSLPGTALNPFDRTVGDALLTFDSNGRLTSVQGNTISIARANTGATDPLSFTVGVDKVSALAVDRSALAVISQDGSPPGTLTDYGIGTDGTINGAFDNGVTRKLGQIALAQFSNTNGLLSLDNNLFRQGPNSGLPFTTTPGSGVGTILSGALELSNVDVAVSFVQLVTASTAFSANSRVIATTQELFQTLLNLPRV